MFCCISLYRPIFGSAPDSPGKLTALPLLQFGGHFPASGEGKVKKR